MTRGAGRSRGYRAQDSELRPGKTVVPFGDKTTICPACRQHKHQACWAHTAALGIGGEPGFPCGCHVPLDEPELTDEAIDDMAAHGTLAEHVKAQKAWALGSGPIHFDEPCRRCAAVAAARTGRQTELPLETP
ncbi:hypothetical protein [Streptomyces sp. NPDC059786]|uniref:hypothetical protein n=1 Tax=Streptomyces sp. NPDC059786 TaxID=3346946 RepID=UPI00364BAE25